VPTKSLRTITGQFLAKASPQLRAELAVRWLGGENAIKPTVKLACSVFAVSYPRLKQARARLERNKHHVDEKHVNGNGSGTVLSNDVVERIIAEVGIERVWRTLDRLTQPTLPLPPAE
jgi:hypothetical protein